MVSPIEWQAREATEPAVLTEKVTVLQGQDFWTQEDGAIEIQFPGERHMTVFENTHLAFIQTLPESFLLLQDSGRALYTLNAPLSIRMAPLLVQQKKRSSRN